MIAQSDTNTTRQREDFTNRWGSLKRIRSSWMSHWQDLSSLLLPRSGRFFTTDRNQGGKRNQRIIDNTATRSLRVMAAGMMAGATSPARPWFRLASADPELNDYQPVRVWLDDVAQRLMRIFQRSNTYRVLHQLYEELGTFGTACSILLPDFENVIHLYPVTVGEFAIATDYQGKVDTLYRECEKTVGEVVREFGRENCSISVQNMWDRNDVDQPVTIIHAIEPRLDRDTTQIDNKNMAWRSIYFEIGSPSGTYLRESGFERFPVLAPRWSVNGNDFYGNSPGMDALGDVAQLQLQQLRKQQGIDYKTKPPLQVPTSLKDRDINMLPGGTTPADGVGASPAIKPMWDVNIDLSHLTADIEDVRVRIRSAFYADLFLMIANSSDTTQRTAAEIAERHEEKLLMLGPVIERLQNELHEPMVDMTFEIASEAGILPPAPPDLHGMELNVEFISMLAQAQRAIGTASVDRFVGNLVALAQSKPEVLDKLNVDEWADSYSDMLGVNPKLIVPDDQVAALRDARNKAMAAKEQLAAQQQQASTAKDLAATPTAPGTALDAVGMFSGY